MNSNKCVICGLPAIRVAFGQIAPFILELSNIVGDNYPTELSKCENCDFHFFTNRFSPNIFESLYSEYRGPKYFKIRKKWEPWYSQESNEALDPGQPTVSTRVQFMESSLRQGLNLEALKVIADVGGDRGQFFPKNFKGDKYLVDISNRELAHDVTQVSKLSEIAHKIDLVICSHVLEHVDDPSEFLASLSSDIDPGSHIYAEVPLDLPRVRPIHNKTFYSNYLRIIRSQKFSWILCDFLTGLYRQFGWKVPGMGAIKQSEHINYFSEKSIKSLFNNSDFEVKVIKNLQKVSIGNIKFDALGILAVKKPNLTTNPVTPQ